MRLTKKEKNILSSNHYVRCDYLLNGTRKVDALNKLGQLEDIEDELGIDLITLFKALKNGVYYKDYKDDDKIKFTKDIEEHLMWKKLNAPAKYTFVSLYFEDYGKTWGLTKEELL